MHGVTIKKNLYLFIIFLTNVSTNDMEKRKNFVCYTVSTYKVMCQPKRHNRVDLNDE